ncbi:MAG: TolC family protein [Zoogloeaceae bacterium]|nr:TolC family protein [Zoogloeaceae bacterium]
MSIPHYRGRLACLGLLIYSLAPPAQALSLEDALLRAGQSPEVRASVADAAAATAEKTAAGRLPDPRLTLSLEDLTLEGEARYRTGQAKQMVSLMQEIPATARREAERKQATAEVEASGQMRDFILLAARREAGLAWLQLYFLQKKEAVLTAQQAENQHKQRASTAALAGGGMAEAALEARLDAQDIQDAQDELRRDLQLARVRLSRWIGPLSASETATGDLPRWAREEPPETPNPTPAHDNLPQELLASQAQIGKAAAELALAEAGRDSDWNVEIGVGRDAMGQSMMMAKVGFSLPFFTGTRQTPKIAAARLRLEKSEAEHAMRQVEFERQEAEWRFEAAALKSRLERLRQETLPLLTQKIALNMAAFSGGQASASALLTAREKRLAALLKIIDLEAEQAALRAKLHFLRQRGQEPHHD